MFVFWSRYQSFLSPGWPGALGSPPASASQVFWGCEPCGWSFFFYHLVWFLFSVLFMFSASFTSFCWWVQNFYLHYRLPPSFKSESFVTVPSESYYLPPQPLFTFVVCLRITLTQPEGVQSWLSSPSHICLFSKSLWSALTSWGFLLGLVLHF